MSFWQSSRHFCTTARDECRDRRANALREASSNNLSPGNTAIAAATSIYFRYDGDVGQGSDNHIFSAGLRMTW